VTFSLDDNLSPRIAEMLRSCGFDAVSAHEVPGNTQLDDRSQLLYAAGARRAIVTCDIEDFAELTGESSSRRIVNTRALCSCRRRFVPTSSPRSRRLWSK